MITMVRDGTGSVPSIAAPEVLQDMESVRDLRDALFQMLEVCLTDDEVKFATPSSSFYVVACLIRELSRDIEADIRNTYADSQQSISPQSV